MVENFPILGREMDIQIHEPRRTPKRLNLNRARLWHIIIKLLEVEGNFENSKRDVTYKGIPIRLQADFSTEKFQVKTEWDGMFKILKSKTSST